MKIINGLTKINLGKGDFYAITCGEKGGRGERRYMGFIPISRELSEKIDVVAKNTIAKAKDEYIKKTIAKIKEHRVYAQQNPKDYEYIEKEMKITLDEWIEGRIKEKTSEYNVNLEFEYFEKHILEHINVYNVLSNVKIITTKKGGKLIVENQGKDDGFLFVTNWYASKNRNCIYSNVENLEKEGKLKILAEGFSANGLAGNMGGEKQFIFSFSNPDLEVEYWEDNGDTYTLFPFKNKSTIN